MTRLLKWLIGIGILLGLIYLALVAVTGSKMRTIADQQVAAYNEQQQDVNVRLEWLDSGFWRSSGVVYIELDDDSLYLSHTLELRHGALRARVSGELTALVDGFDVGAELFAGDPIRLDGRIGLGGLMITYQTPELDYVDDSLNTAYQGAPATLDVVLREHEQHTLFKLDWLEATASIVGTTDVLRFDGVAASSQVRLHSDDGKIEHARSHFAIQKFEFSDDAEPTVSLEEVDMEVELQRDNEEIQALLNVDIEAYDVYGVRGDLTIATHTTGMPFTSFEAWIADEGSSEATSSLLSSLREAGTQFVIEEVALSMGELGDLVAEGHFTLRDDIEFTPEVLGGSAIDFLEGQLLISDLPFTVLIPLASFVSGELPWNLELQQGSLTINGEPVALPQ